MSGNSDDEFDRIVEGLELEFGIDDSGEDRVDDHDDELVGAGLDDGLPDDDLPDELDWFDDDAGYEEATVYEPATGPIDLGLNLGWAGALGVPLLMTLSTLMGITLPRAVVFAAALLFVAGVVYLFSRIPRERRGEDGDDGAVV